MTELNYLCGCHSVAAEYFDLILIHAKKAEPKAPYAEHANVFISKQIPYKL